MGRIHIASLFGAAAVLAAGSFSAFSVEAAARRAGQVFQDCANCPSMVVVPAGSFMMGTPATEPGRDPDEGQHRVTFAKPYAVARYLITWDQWEACVRDAHCDGPGVETALRTGREGKPIENYVDHGRGNRPVVGISWYDAQTFVGWLNKKAGSDAYHLLSEAEFEYAARAGTTTVYPWGDKADHNFANYGTDDGQPLGGATGGRDVWGPLTSPVGSFPPNAWGLYDMQGNTWQWIEDCYQPDPTKLPTDGSPQKDVGCHVRGMKSNSYESHPQTLRPGNRFYPYVPTLRGRNYMGIRVAKTLP